MPRSSAKSTSFGSKASGGKQYLSRMFGKSEYKRAAARGFTRGVKPGYAQIATVVRGMGLRGETKSVDIPTGVINFNVGNLNSVSFTLIQEGASFYNRIGRKTALKSLQITGTLQQQGAGTSLTEEMVRYIIFWDKQPNGIAATWNQIVQDYDNTGGVTNDAYCGLNLDQRDRFVVLRDRKIAMPRTGVTGVATSVPYGTAAGSVGSGGSDGGAMVKEYIKLGNLESQFNGTANPATVGQISTGNLAIVVQGSTGAQWQFTLNSRLRFTDC